jgi:hypothetical protein
LRLEEVDVMDVFAIDDNVTDKTSTGAAYPL